MLNTEKQKFYFYFLSVCHEYCTSCFGISEYNCLSCVDPYIYFALNTTCSINNYSDGFEISSEWR